MARKLEYAGRTDVGRKRAHNEDYFGIIPDSSLFIVADGMGGHSAGEVASRLAVETVTQFFQENASDPDRTWPYRMQRALSYAANLLATGIRLANLRIHQEANAEIDKKGMGTTFVGALVSGEEVVIAHVGDSRLYRVRKGEIAQVTRDHSLLEDYKLAKPDLTAEEEKNFPHKNVITRALGMRDNVEVDVRQEGLLPGDVLLLCCDGLSGMVPDQRMCEIVTSSPSLDSAAAQLIDDANAAGGIDNITVVLVRCAA